MSKIELYHGSDHVIEKPDFSLGKANNDYGRGFYCTREVSMAMEWACKQNTDGFVNRYSFEQDALHILNLFDGDYTVLHWMALLLKNRTFRLSNEIAMDARDYIMDHFLIDLKDYDVVIGYRADDSYFSFAESFVQNGLSLRSLNQALRLGKLGEQTVLISEKAFANIKFENAELADKTIYYPKFVSRDSGARETYKKEIRNSRSYKDDIFVLDILREEMKQDDSRIQRMLSE
ncbi:MAG: DUF3990 domain-containing protein [Clostridium sp.]|nr:DUF3990 domain-containing protein [Clostridium sp.]MDY5484190.1 DUF3990 domain-containing protein [Clostridium sp.]